MCLHVYVCWYVSCGCLFKLLPLLSVCLFLYTHLHSPSLLFIPLPLSSRLSSITLLASLISLFHTTLLSTHNKLPLPYTLSHTSILPSPYSLSTHHPFLSLSLPLSIYHLPFPFSLPHCRISSSFLTCQVMKFKMAYRRHFGSGLDVPTKRGKSFV